MVDANHWTQLDTGSMCSIQNMDHKMFYIINYWPPVSSSAPLSSPVSLSEPIVIRASSVAALQEGSILQHLNEVRSFMWGRIMATGIKTRVQRCTYILSSMGCDDKMNPYM